MNSFKKQQLTLKCIYHNSMIDLNKCLHTLSKLTPKIEDEELEEKGIAFIEPNKLLELLCYIIDQLLNEDSSIYESLLASSLSQLAYHCKYMI